MIADKDFQYSGIDDDGIRYNKAYPPDKKKYGNNYGGYANNAREVLLYDFAVQGYDVSFRYNGKSYHLLYESDHAALCDDKYSTEYISYDNPMDLIENLKIEGHTLIDIIDELEDVEPE